METFRMTAKPLIDVKTRQSGGVTEIYITARPQAEAEAKTQATAILESVADVLRRHEVSILQERIFADAAAMDIFLEARDEIFGSLADEVQPTQLVVPANSQGPIIGMQIHAVAGCGKPKILSVAGKPCGRLVQYGSGAYLAGCNLQADAPADPPLQAQAMLAKAESLLAEAGGTLADVARTWMWLEDILEWYGDFNRVRNDLFKARGLMTKDGNGKPPASTGIGIGPFGQQCCAMDFCAVIGGEKIEFLPAAGNQGPASKYGSSFSRAAIANTPAGRTVYVSGTAAIDAAGQTTHIGNACGQIEDTLNNVWAVLGNTGCRKEDIVQVIVYCKTPQVEQIFREEWGNLPMPHIAPIADVCRDNLLFEIEATAMPK